MQCFFFCFLKLDLQLVSIFAQVLSRTLLLSHFKKRLIIFGRNFDIVDIVEPVSPVQASIYESSLSLLQFVLDSLVANKYSLPFFLVKSQSVELYLLQFNKFFRILLLFFSNEIPKVFRQKRNQNTTKQIKQCVYKNRTIKTKTVKETKICDISIFNS